MCDRKGAIYQGREGLNWIKTEMAEVTNLSRKAGTLADMLVGADVFIGVSAPNTVTTEMVKTMNRDAIIFRLREPDAGDLPRRGEGGRRKGLSPPAAATIRIRSTTCSRSPASSAVRSTYARVTSTKR